eukprot:Pgem_evm1s13167
MLYNVFKNDNGISVLFMRLVGEKKLVRPLEVRLEDTGIGSKQCDKIGLFGNCPKKWNKMGLFRNLFVS